MVFREGTLEAMLENRGTLVISGSTDVVNLELKDTSLLNKQFVSQEQVILVSRVSFFPWAKGIGDVQYGLEYTRDLKTREILSAEVTETEDLGLISRISLSADLPMEAEPGVFVRLAVSEI
jgi:hypothetical protein